MIPGAYLVALLTLTLGAADPQEPDGGVLIPGHETAAVGLLAPDDLDSFHCDDWTLDTLIPGPDCALRFHMRDPGGSTMVVRLSHDLTASATDGPPAVRDCVARRVAENAGPEFFRDRCVLPRAAVRVEVRGSGGPVRLALLGLAALLALGMLLWRRRPTNTPPARTSGRDLLVLAAWVAPALGLRAWLMTALPPGAYELENFGKGTPFAELLQQTGALLGWLDPIPPAFHPPLVRTFLDPWLMLGDGLGVGGTLWWLRLPNLGLTAFGVGLLVRLGRLLDAPAAGRLAAILFAWLPATVLITVFQGHYGAEMILCLWFLERLGTWVLGERDVFLSLPLAGALALWTGHLAALTVGPGMLVFLVTAHRRGRRLDALASLLLLLALYLPIAESAALGATGYAGASVSGPLSPTEAAAIATTHGHNVLPVTTPSLFDALSLPLRLPLRLFGPPGAALAFLALGLLYRRWRLALFPGVLVLLYILAQAGLSTRWENLSPLFPLVLLGTALGLDHIRRSEHRLARRIPWVAVFLVLSLAGGGWSAWRHADGAGVTEIVGQLTHEDSENSLAARMMDDRYAGLPVLLLAPADRFPYHLCPDRSTVNRIGTCIREADAPAGEPGPHLYSLGDRAIGIPRIMENDEGGCPDLAGILGAAPFDGGYLVVLSWDSALGTEGSPCPQRFHPENCNTLGRAPGLQLLHCGAGENNP